MHSAFRGEGVLKTDEKGEGGRGGSERNEGRGWWGRGGGRRRGGQGGGVGVRGNGRRKWPCVSEFLAIKRMATKNNQDGLVVITQLRASV